jgi:hypothetical protein
VVSYERVTTVLNPDTVDLIARGGLVLDLVRAPFGTECSCVAHGSGNVTGSHKNGREDSATCVTAWNGVMKNLISHAQATGVPCPQENAHPPRIDIVPSWHRPTAGSFGVVFSCDQGTPVHVFPSGVSMQSQLCTCHPIKQLHLCEYVAAWSLHVSTKEVGGLALATGMKLRSDDLEVNHS